MKKNIKNKRHLVYLASNNKGLDVERYELERLLAKHHMINIALPCRDDVSPYDWELVREQIESADLFVLLLGDEYGPMLPTGISYIHREFVHAKLLNKPILAFLKNSAPGKVFSENQRRLEGLHRIVMEQAAHKIWHLRDELVSQVRSAITSNLLSIGQGWARVGEKIIEQAESEELLQQKTQQNNRQRLALTKQMLNLQISSKVYQGGNLTLVESFIPSRLDLIYDQLLPLLSKGASEDRLRKKIESSVTAKIVEEQRKKHPKSHAVDDIRLSRTQFQQMLKSWLDLGLVEYSGVGSQLIWKLPLSQRI